MQINKKNIIFPSILILFAALVIFSIAKASSGSGNFTPATPSVSGMYTLQNIFDKLTDNGNHHATPTHNLYPSAIPASGTVNLQDIYNAIPGAGGLPAIDPTTVASGTIYLGVDGTANIVPTYIWQTDQHLNLCWDASTLNQTYCHIGSGILNVGSGLGAKEYCQHLRKDKDGGSYVVQESVDTEGTGGTPYWHLPTLAEAIIGETSRNNSCFFGNLPCSGDYFTYGGSEYWTSSVDVSGHPYYIQPNGNVIMEYTNDAPNYKNMPWFTLCVHANQ